MHSPKVQWVKVGLKLMLTLFCTAYKRNGSFTQEKMTREVPQRLIAQFRSLTACRLELTETFQGKKKKKKIKTMVSQVFLTVSQIIPSVGDIIRLQGPEPQMDLDFQR